MNYFAYGSNLWLCQMNKRCPNNRIYGYGILKKYRWIVNERGYANIIDSEEDEVHGGRACRGLPRPGREED